MNEVYNIYVIHGYTANPSSNWFPYLKNNIESENLKVHILAMPNSQSPSFDEWINYIEQEIAQTQQKCIFVGHSLGCVTILNYLRNKDLRNVQSIFMVSGFVEETPIPQLSEFMSRKIDYNKIIEEIPHRLVISAEDDDIIPYNYSKKLADKIKADFTLLKHGKHFIDRDGFTEFPLLVKLIKETILL